MKIKSFVLLLPVFFAFGLSAQTHFPAYPPSANYSAAKTDTDSFEELVAQWDAGLNEVKQQVNAGDKDFAAFTNFYQAHIDSGRAALIQQVISGKINPSNVASYMKVQKQNLSGLYANFNKIKNNYQAPKLAPSYTPPTCNAECTNMDFSDQNFTGWYGYYAVNNSSTTNYSIRGITGGYLGNVQRGAYCPITETYQVHLTSAANNDWFLSNYHGINMSQASPWGNGFSAMIGDSTNKGGIVAILSQEFQVTASTNSITYAYSILLENPNHAYYQQPFFSVTVFDQNGDTIKNCGEYAVYSGPGLAGFKAEYYPVRASDDTVYWRDWTEVNVPLIDYIGQCVTIQFEVSDCEPTGHFGYAYVDASCSEFSISASSPTGVICGKNGSITLDGPAGEKAYSWTGPAGGIIGSDTTQNINVDSLGKYTLIITPVTGALCKDTLVYTVKSRDTISASAAVTSLINCHGGTGAALAKEKNGFGPFTYAWAPLGGSGATGTGLTAGAYTVTIQDTNACPATAVVTLTQPTLIVPVTSFTQATCGNNNGTASVTVTGGYSPYTYAWNPSAQTTATASNLSAGTYTITVTDKNHCSVTAAVTVTQPSVVTAAITAITAVSCFGGSNGAATVTASNGVSPYTYNWVPTGGSNATATGLTAAIYTVTVKDSNGCKATVTANISQPALLTATAGSINAIPCFGEKGSATVTPAGGTSPYTYLWAPSAQTSPTGTGLTVGIYSIAVSDKNGCTTSVTVNMTQPAVLAVTGTFTQASCNLPNGTATANATGGTLPYTYAWDPSRETTMTATGLSIGTYSVGVTDKNGCTASTTVTVTQPSLVTARVTSITNVSCFNGDNGTATATPSGGTSPYTYLWTPSANTDATATSLFAVSYTVKVTDANGCTTTANTSLSEPAQLTITINEPRIICKDSTGNLLAIVGGGMQPYTYAWSAGIASTTSTASVTPSATRDYSVTITDANGCTATSQIILQYGPAIAVTIGGQTSICKGDSTTLCVLSAGGTGGNSYMWSPVGYTTPCITAAPAVSGLYTVLVTDNCGATATAGTTIYSTPSPQINFGSDFVQGCVPFCIKFINATTISRGIIQQYIWAFGNGDTVRTANPVYCYPKSGNYDVSLTAVSDSGCSSTLSKVDMIQIYDAPRAAFTYSPPSTTILSPTIYFADKSTAENGGIVYWWWGFGDGKDSAGTNVGSAVHTYGDTGTYCPTLIVMDNHGCTDTATNCLVIGPAFKLYIPSAFTPNQDGLNETFQPVGQYIKSFDMYIFDRWGMEIYHTTDINAGWNGAVHGTGAICQEDTYVYKVTVTSSDGTQHSYVGNVTLLK